MREPANAPVVVEVAVESVAGAIAAARGGADRIELCQALGDGGLTPSRGLLEAVKAAVALPVFAMVRPRGGDFLYDDGEFAVMRRDVAHLRDAGADGIVTGVLTAAGAIDREHLGALLAAAGGLPVTCHRAFDVCADPDAAIDALCALGVARVLTSGQAANAAAGAAAIRAAVQRAAGRLTVLAGAGVDAGNVAALVRATGVREVHLSATSWTDSAMAFRRPGVPMASAARAHEYALRRTDADLVARVVAALRGA